MYKHDGIILYIHAVYLLILTNCSSSFNPSPLERSTVWTYLIGGFFRVLNPYVCSQMFIQRYGTLETPEKAKLYVSIGCGECVRPTIGWGC